MVRRVHTKLNEINPIICFHSFPCCVLPLLQLFSIETRYHDLCIPPAQWPDNIVVQGCYREYICEYEQYTTKKSLPRISRALLGKMRPVILFGILSHCLSQWDQVDIL